MINLINCYGNNNIEIQPNLFLFQMERFRLQVGMVRSFTVLSDLLRPKFFIPMGIG